jgi:hypothetical protein
MGLPRENGCGPPSDIWSTPAELQAISEEVERIIVGHFRTSNAARGVIDIFTDPRVKGPDGVIDWLFRNSFGRVIDRAKMKRGFDQAQYSVPDIITNRGTVDKSEFYEIKANSDTGKREGFSQIAQFTKLNADFLLLFFPGLDYDPIEARFHSTISTGIYEIDIELHWFRHAAGLILYEFCWKVKVKHRVLEISLAVLMALLAALFFMMLKGRGGAGGFSPTPTVA